MRGEQKKNKKQKKRKSEGEMTEQATNALGVENTPLSIIFLPTLSHSIHSCRFSRAAAEAMEERKKLPMKYVYVLLIGGLAGGALGNEGRRLLQ